MCQGPDKPLHEAVQVKPGSPWRPQDVEDVRGELLTGVEPAQEGQVVLQSTKPKGVGGLTWRCRVRSFPVCFGPVFPRYASFSPPAVPLQCEVCDLLLILVL